MDSFLIGALSACAVLLVQWACSRRAAASVSVPVAPSWFPLDGGSFVDHSVREEMARALVSVTSAGVGTPGERAFKRRAAGEDVSDLAVFASIAGDELAIGQHRGWSRLAEQVIDWSYALRGPEYEPYFSVAASQYGAMMSTLRAASAGDAAALSQVRQTVLQMATRYRINEAQMAAWCGRTSSFEGAGGGALCAGSAEHGALRAEMTELGSEKDQEATR